MEWAQLTLTREDLYRDVRAEPAQTVARRFGISGTALAQICRKLSVPTPPNGYWAKKASGQAVSRPQLPKLARGAPDKHKIRRYRSPWDESGFSPVARAAMERERTVGAEIRVADELKYPHPLVESAAPLLGKAGLRARSDVLSTEKCLDIVVSPAQLVRALRRYVSRTSPDAPAIEAITPRQVRLLHRIATMKGRGGPAVKMPPNPTARDALLAVAKLGGQLKSNGDPGWQVLGRGYGDLLLMELGWRARESRGDL